MFFFMSIPTSISNTFRGQSNRDQRSLNSNNFNGVGINSYEVLIYKHTVGKDKGTKNSKCNEKKSRNH